MIFIFIYIVISFIVLFLGTSQILGKSRRSALNWYFFAICAVIAISTFNNGVQFYKAFTEGVALGESSYIFTKSNMILSIIKLMIVPFLFSFILILSKIKSKGIKTLQYVLLSVNTLKLIVNMGRVKALGVI